MGGAQPRKTATGKKAFRVALVFPPTMEFPTATPPLGIAYLKSFISEAFDGRVSVSCRDLNVSFQNRMFLDSGVRRTLRGLCKDVLGASAAKDLSKLRKIPVEEVSALLASQNKYKTFRDDWAYREGLTLLTKYADVFHSAFNRLSEALCQLTGDIPFEKLDGLFAGQLSNLARHDVVGMSALYATQLPVGLLMAKAVKHFNPKASVLLGGAAFSQMSERDCKALLFPGSPIDGICDGEGEVTLREFCRFVLGDIKREAVPGLIYAHDGGLARTLPEIVKRVDELPFPDFDDMDFSAYHAPAPVYPIQTARGCSWNKCSFCDYNCNYDSKYRPRSIDNIMEELKARAPLQKGRAYLSFDDSEIPARRAKNIAERLIGEGFSARYFFLARPTKDFTKEILITLKESGCKVICFGVESFNQRIIDLERKGTRVKEARKALKATHKAGIDAYCLYFTGFPTQTAEDIGLEIKALVKNAPYISNLANASFVLLQNSAALELSDYVEVDWSRYEPAFYFCGNPIYPRHFPYIMREGMNGDEAETAMEIIHNSYLAFSSGLRRFGRPEYHQIFLGPSKPDKKARRDMAAFKASHAKRFPSANDSISLDTKLQMVERIFPHPSYLKSYVAGICLAHEH